MRRRTEVEVIYNGKRNISPYLMSLSYTDNSDKTDDISLVLADRERRWSGAWFPKGGDTLTVKIKVKDWLREGDDRELDLGAFEVDQVVQSGTVTVNAVSVPIKATIRTEKKDKAWENINLKSITKDIADKAGLKLVYESDYVPRYARKDQEKQSDLEFIEELCKEDGMCVKVANKQLIIFDEYKYDLAEPTVTIAKGKSNIIGEPSLSLNAKNIYKACEIKYYNSDTDKTSVAYFSTEDVVTQSNTLKLNEEINETLSESVLVRKAKSRLREQNK